MMSEGTNPRGRPRSLEPGSLGGVLVLRWLEQTGRSLSAVAGLAGVSRSYLTRVISGERQPTYHLALWLETMGAAPYRSWSEPI